MARMWLQVMVCLVLGGTVSSLQCPNGRKCEESSTCCKLPGGDEFICCNQPQFTGTSLRMLPSVRGNKVSGVECPDGSTCPAEHSCQLTLDAAFACCPWLEAISCAEGLHCCPFGTHCSADGKTCVPNKDLSSAVFVGAVQCPGSEWECPDDSTCCLMIDGSWGCCPMPKASCCADKIHCCPHGATCDLAQGRCLGASGEQLLSKKFPAKKKVLALDLTQKRMCPGNHSSCPDTATCCLFPTGSYGCCLLQDAVCCSDHLHCCPQDTQCDLKHSRCIIMGPQRSWPLTPLSENLQTVHDIECDAKFRCPDGNTCCKITSDSWGCCPLEEAVCCKDQAHCCPKGYSCDIAHSTCVRREGHSLGLSLTPILARQERFVICDNFTICEDGQTCCQLASGAWACCPFSQAICCSDHMHCCPAGFTCDPDTGRCLFLQHSLPWAPKLHAKRLQKDSIHCNDTVSCEEGQTCCRNTAGSWSCCQLPNAVCCEDHQHCCPSGYTCNVAAQTCEKRRQLSPFAVRGQPNFSQRAARRPDVL